MEKDIDVLYSCEPILITNRKVNKKEFPIKTFDIKDIPKIDMILKKFKSNALILRPDRYVFASSNEKDLVKFSKSSIDQIYN